MLRTHLTNLEEALRNHAAAIAFKIPTVDAPVLQDDWVSITYSQFAQDIECLSRYWLHNLSRSGIERGSVVALCLGGYEYIDVVQVYAISKAGYIPHTFSRLPGIPVVKELLHKSDTKALIRSETFTEILKEIDDIPIFGSVQPEDVGYTDDIPAPPERKASDTALIAHTSGSTSGAPKLVYVSYQWVDGAIKKFDKPWRPMERVPGVVNWIVKTGDCVLQPRKPGNLDEIIHLLKHDVLDTMFIFAPFLVKLLNISHSDQDLRTALTRLKEITTGGATLPRSAEDYAVKNHINIANIYATTEGGLMMSSMGTKYDPSNSLRVVDVPGVLYQFIPVTHGETESDQPSTKLLELLVSSDSIDCPPLSFRSPEDGHWHTGDLWEQVENGGYIYRGRDDDWIKSENACRCDASAIEDNTRMTCGDLIFDCVVVGNGRPSPALFVEPKDGTEYEKLKEDIFSRIQPFNNRRIAHERIASPQMIVVIPKNELPRTATKGNIRRRAAEEMYQELLDRIYV
ncbi:hypothetical protein VNI00_010749 [Paramarasmius palmivorus]|uniref:AMP-dependent synthetase/ligase domain-containing protein n=1 Tax=Paramarasmius palmivorus TaxID=297713 RepID=A0AAW0CFX9_9AGAR